MRDPYQQYNDDMTWLYQRGYSAYVIHYSMRQSAPDSFREYSKGFDGIPAENETAEYRRGALEHEFVETLDADQFRQYQIGWKNASRNLTAGFVKPKDTILARLPGYRLIVSAISAIKDRITIKT